MYNIGQLLWLIVDASKSIEPVQVISKATLESIEGVNTQHNVQLADGKKFCLEEYEATAFQTVEEAESHLLEMATTLVKKLVIAAEKKAVVFAVHKTRQVAERPTAKTKESSEREKLPLVELPDGTMARVHLPESLQ
jgi:uncharacterized protein YabN with tetrapyrrole methylase and pyrophosphatase domain